MARYQAGLKTQEKILEATRDLLVGGGVEGVTIKSICDRAGIQPGSFYNLFDSKEQAILSVVRDAINAVDPHPSGEPDTVRDLIEAYTRFITEQSELARVYLRIAISGGLGDGELGERATHHHFRRLARFTEAIARQHPELPEEEAELQAEVLLATLNGLAFMWLVEPGFDFAGHAERLWMEPVA